MRAKAVRMSARPGVYAHQSKKRERKGKSASSPRGQCACTQGTIYARVRAEWRLYTKTSTCNVSTTQKPHSAASDHFSVPTTAY